jgi:hypothetical protein
MVALNDKIVAYLTLEGISFGAEDFATGHATGELDKVLRWNEATLGFLPSEEILDQSHEAYSSLQQWDAVRSDRNARLAACDWTQVADAPVDQVAWATYRQALRDVPAQPDPFNIVWPEAP